MPNENTFMIPYSYDMSNTVNELYYIIKTDSLNGRLLDMQEEWLIGKDIAKNCHIYFENEVDAKQFIRKDKIGKYNKSYALFTVDGELIFEEYSDFKPLIELYPPEKKKWWNSGNNLEVRRLLGKAIYEDTIAFIEQRKVRGKESSIAYRPQVEEAAKLNWESLKKDRIKVDKEPGFMEVSTDYSLLPDIKKPTQEKYE